MPVHNVEAAPEPPRSMWYGSLAEARPTATAGPAFVVAAPNALLQVALVAASIWNRYLPHMEPRYFHVEYNSSLPANVVGQIVWPCHPPPAVCNVSVDPTYGAPLNVLVHEFGHGLGLPANSVSGIGSTVDSGNHWAPESVDAREIMTETIHAEPYLALYTLRAMDPDGHLGCVGDYQCKGDLVCMPASIYDSPGACERRSETLISSAHSSDDMALAYAVGVVGACAFAGFLILILV